MSIKDKASNTRKRKAGKRQGPDMSKGPQHPRKTRVQLCLSSISPISSTNTLSKNPNRFVLILFKRRVSA